MLVQVNNAGICVHKHTQDLFDTSMEDFDRTQAVDFRGVFLGLKHASRWAPSAAGSSCTLSGTDSALPRPDKPTPRARPVRDPRSTVGAPLIAAVAGA